MATARVGLVATRTRDREALSAAVAEARKLGLVGLELEARLALVELSRGEDSAALAREARSRGYLALATQAERAAAR